MSLYFFAVLGNAIELAEGEARREGIPHEEARRRIGMLSRKTAAARDTSIAKALERARKGPWRGAA